MAHKSVFYFIKNEKHTHTYTPSIRNEQHATTETAKRYWRLITLIKLTFLRRDQSSRLPKLQTFYLMKMNEKHNDIEWLQIVWLATGNTRCIV